MKTVLGWQSHDPVGNLEAAGRRTKEGVLVLRFTLTLVCLLCTGSLAATDSLVPAQKFIRGDCNGDGSQNIADARALIRFLFDTPLPPFDPPCLDACDTDDNGVVDIADVVLHLETLYPGPTSCPVGLGCPDWLQPRLCGVDPTADSLLCGAFASCP